MKYDLNIFKKKKKHDTTTSDRVAFEWLEMDNILSNISLRMEMLTDEEKLDAHEI